MHKGVVRKNTLIVSTRISVRSEKHCQCRKENRLPLKKHMTTGTASKTAIKTRPSSQEIR